jgi:hypothetical protein
MLVVPWLMAIVTQAAAAGPMEVAGRVVDAKGQPVAGAELWVAGFESASPEQMDQVKALKTPLISIMSFDAKPRGVSDAEGRFRFTMPAPRDARVAELPWTVLASHAKHGLGVLAVSRQDLKKGDGDGVEVKLAAPGGSEVRVVRPNGKPVAGVGVFPIILRVGPVAGSVNRDRQISEFPLPDELAKRLGAKTGPDGRGTIAAVAPRDLHSVLLEVPPASRQLVAATAGPDGVSVFTLLPVGRVKGRVVVDDPKLLKGLKIHMFSRPTGGQNASGTKAEAVPDASGRFEVAELPVGQLLVNVQVPEKSALKFILPRFMQIEADQTTEVTITERKPPKVRTIAGRVVDTKGKPVAKATVFQSGDAPARTETTSDTEGRFSLPGVAEAATFVFARAAGFRFAGRGVKAGESDVTITLVHENERPIVSMATLAPAATPEQESAAAHRLIDAYATKVLAKGDTNDKVRLLEVLARVDPARALELTERKTFKEPFLNAMIRERVAAGLFESAPDEGLAVAESIDDPAGRALALLKGVETLPPSEKPKKLELLDRALVAAKAAREPTGIRVLLMAQVAEHWLDMGLTEKGKTLLRDALPDAEQLPDEAWPSYAKATFAEELCQVDLETALKLTKGLSGKFEYDRHHGNIAHELAGKDPVAAERVLGMVKEPYQHDEYTVRVVYRMAPVDLARARRLAPGTVNPVMSGYALGMGALALADAKKTDEATALLREALNILDTGGGFGESPTRHPSDRASACAALLTVAERIHPDLVPETFWRTLSLRYPRPPDTARDPNGFCDVRIAVLLARYDRGVARELLARHIGPEAGEPPGERGLAFAAAAVIDPAWAVELVERLPEDPDVKVNQTKNDARLAVAAVLARHGEARWRYLQSHYAYLWVADTEDLGGQL